MSVVVPPQPSRTGAGELPMRRTSSTISKGSVGRPRRARRIPGRWLSLVGAVVVVVPTVAWFLWDRWDPADANLVYYSVRPTTLEITVLERGNLESQSSVEVMCEVDDVPGNNTNGTPLVWIVPNGTSVKQGDLIVEFDSATHQERLDAEILDRDRARAKQIQAEVKFENQKTQNETTLAEARLKVELAELALEQFEDDEGGTFQIELQDVELQVQEADASRLIEETNLAGVEQLYRLGYRSSGELAQARLSALRAERQLATSLSKKKELVDYQYRKQKMELEGQLASARRALEQVARDNEALLAQAEAAYIGSNEELAKEEERLVRYREQLQKCKIYAPQSGMVAYAVSGSRYSGEEIRPGATIRPRQKILTIPNLERMQVKTAVHESVLDQVKAGLPVTIRVDAFPDRSYQGKVQSVAVLPDQAGWMSSDTKVYETLVTIDEAVEHLKPGMTAVVEIRVDRLEEVLAVPVQAVLQREGATWCFADTGRGPQRQEIEVGRTNDKFVQIVNGLRTGDRIVLNPTDTDTDTDAETADGAQGPGTVDDAQAETKGAS